MYLKKLLTFLGITLLWSWGLWLAGLHFLSDGISESTIGIFIKFFFAGVYGPSLAAMVTTLIFDGWQGLGQLIKKLFKWRVSVSVYAYIIVLPIVFVLVGILLYNLFVDSIGKFDVQAYLLIPTVLWAGLYAGPLGEELGWRGFLLTELQKKYTPLQSAVLIGLIWFVWHIPLWWAPFGTLVSGAPITIWPVVMYLTMLVCLSVMLTWLVNKAKGSVLVAILFHLSINAGIALLFFPSLAVAFKKVHLLSGVAMLVFTGILIAKKQLKKTVN